MGKGDRKTKRGKIWLGTFGRLRRPSESKPKSQGTESQPTKKG